MSLVTAFTPNKVIPKHTSKYLSSGFGQPTDLPDSLDDSAVIAAQGCVAYANDSGPMQMCRVDFDTSIGDETYTTLKSSTEFMQKFVSALCYEMIPGVQDMRQNEMMVLVRAKEELRQIYAREENNVDKELQGSAVDNDSTDLNPKTSRIDQLRKIISNGGRESSISNSLWDGPKARIYFPDEGSAALARRDWNPTATNPEEALVPPCVEFSSCGGIQLQDVSNDVLIFFFCPQASEAEFIEKALLKSEEELGEKLKLIVFVNPLLVNMGVTGFGMAGRMLRERLIDKMMPTYYLRTLAWGALTRLYPRQFTVWQEDEDADDGYRLIRTLDRLPSNPEVEDIYDYENVAAQDTGKTNNFGLIKAFGSFVNDMMKL